MMSMLKPNTVADPLPPAGHILAAEASDAVIAAMNFCQLSMSPGHPAKMPFLDLDLQLLQPWSKHPLRP